MKSRRHRRHSKKNDPWMITALILGIALVVSVFTNGFRFGDSLGLAIHDIEKTAQKVDDASTQSVLKNLAHNLQDIQNKIKGQTSSVAQADQSSSTANAQPATNNNNNNNPDEVVSFDMYVMSQCPYGTQVMDAIAPVKEKLGNALDLNINYILYPASNYAGQESQFCIDDLCSMHGVNEVKGDMFELCTKKYAPEKYLDVISCMDQDRTSIPDNFDDCAKQANIQTDQIKACADGDEGKSLLTQSAKMSSDAGATGSPTMILQGEAYSGGRTTDDFLRQICYKFNTKPEACKSIPDPVKVELTILNDKGCSTCDPTNIIQVTKQLFPGVVVRVIDVSSEEGQKFVKDYGAVVAPSFYFDSKLNETATWKSRPQLAGAFEKQGPYYKLLDSQTGAKYYIDPVMRAKVLQAMGITKGDNKPQMDFFVMSFCPYGNSAEEAIYGAYKILGDKVEWKPHYIFYSNYQGGGPTYCLDNESKYCSMHGIQEVHQDIRELCVLDQYGIDSWFKFATEINEKCSAQDADTCWTDVAKDLNLDTAKISECQNTQGIELAQKELNLDSVFGAQGSPTVYVDGQEYNGQRSPAGYQGAVCSAFDSAPAECQTAASTATASTATTGSCG